MNVYDFDKTIYSGDSTVDFYIYSLCNRPSIIRYMGVQIYGFLLYITGKIDKTRLKEYFFLFLRDIDTEKFAEDFWSKNSHKLKQWYISKKEYDDVIISASPEFLLLPMCEHLGITKLIASKVNINTGKFISKNCYGQEKLFRFNKEFSNATINEFYSDSRSDAPLAAVAEKAFIMKKGKITIWDSM